MALKNSKYINLIRLLRNERRSLDELINLQNIALRKLVKHAYETVNFYKQLFDEIGVHPSDIKTVEDITKLPVIDKQILIKNSYDKLISSNYKSNNLISVKTGGSSGISFMFFIDNPFDQFRKAQYLRPYITNGRRLFDHSINFSLNETSPKKWFHQLGIMPQTRISSSAEITDQIKTLQTIKPNVIQGYGSVLNLLSVKIIKDKILVPKPRLIFTDSELLMPDMRQNIEKAFGTKVIDIYGTFETDNISYECSHHNGYHIAMDCVIMEFLKDGKPVSQNEQGEIVVTVLKNYAMPFIRYNLHDIGSLSKAQCSCNRTFPLMNQIIGRANDYMHTKDGRKIPFFNLAHFDCLAPEINEYQIIQENFNLFTLNIIPGIIYNKEAEKKIIPEIKKYFPRAKININLVQLIKRGPSGKFKTFISKVENQ